MAAISSSDVSTYVEASGLPKISSDKLTKSLSAYPFLQLKEILPPEGTATINDARIIFLGDSNHTDDKMRLLYQKFIEAVAKDGDIVLIEAKPCLVLQDSRKMRATSSISKKILVYGWDDYEKWKQGIELIQVCRKCYEVEERLKIQPKSDANDTLINKLGLKLDECMEKFKVLTPERDASLIKAVQTCFLNLKPLQRIFVIAGKAHLKPENIHHFKSERYFHLDFANTEVKPEEYYKQAKEGYQKSMELKKTDA
jgi:hypothetical protein